ncbi:hypothetical protein [Shinella oryzae]|uniref:hypothetical protein n=1 Tax=Shinella oryzae TaxID=2871820 RepID=UPI001FF19286|nr:hypothetical protein [Shinella oryzae]UPA24582.1 hypothetical protein K6301_15845 [Shinella oryzae]
MSRVRSPSYPSINIEQAIAFAEKIHSSNRTNPIDREAAVRDMGYSGITGHSGKMIASMLQYGLLEKFGKGEVRISTRAVDILHPDVASDRLFALNSAAFEPELFSRLRIRFADGVPSENNLRSFLVREGFSDVAVGPAVSSYLETCRFLQLENAYDLSKGASEDKALAIRDAQEGGDVGGEQSMLPVTTSAASATLSRVTPVLSIAQSERIVLTEESEPGQYIKLIASGDIDEGLIEALEDFIKRQRKRLNSKQPL